MSLGAQERPFARDAFGALCRQTHVTLSGSPSGPLAGRTFVAKDVFDVQGHRTGAGSPDWLATHDPAPATAPVIEKLLAAGASMVGRAHTDEIAYSLNGQNVHYGTPINPRAPGRISGGSSSGSAVAVAGGLVDFSIGTDCGGSVRIPASYCGILGFRPTHGRILLANAVPLAPSFDTAGWFARDADMLEVVGQVLLTRWPSRSASRLLVAEDLFALAPAPVGAALERGMTAAGKDFPAIERGNVLPQGKTDWLAVFRTIQGAEAWMHHGEWVRRVRPNFGPGVRERFEFASKVTSTELAAARLERERLAAHMRGFLEDGTVICLPTAPGVAPLKNAPAVEIEDFRARALRLLCVAGLAGLPQVTLPLGKLEGLPVGLSLIAAPDADSMLLALTREVMESWIDRD